jgi:hypothetical protein
MGCVPTILEGVVEAIDPCNQSGSSCIVVSVRVDCVTDFDRLTYEDREYWRYYKIKPLFIVGGHTVVHEDELGVQCNSASIEC